MARTINFNINWYNGTKTGKYAYIVELFMSLLLSMAHSHSLAHTDPQEIYFCFYRFCLLHRINFLFASCCCSLFVHTRACRMTLNSICVARVCIIHIAVYYTSILCFILYARITALNFAKMWNVFQIFLSLPTWRWVRRSEMCTRLDVVVVAVAFCDPSVLAPVHCLF